MLTDEEDRQIKEHLAQINFGMTLDEFTEAWKAGEFDEDQERQWRRHVSSEAAS